MEDTCTRQPPLIIDIGAAEGYYAVGLALRNPETKVIAFEAEERGRAALQQMAILNGVTNRLEIQGRCDLVGLQSALAQHRACLKNPTEIRSLRFGIPPLGGSHAVPPKGGTPNAIFRHAHEGALVICDVEGDEEHLLDPIVVPALKSATILSEMHDFIRPGITEEIQRRFATTHHCEQIWQEPRTRRDFPFQTIGTALLPRSYLDWAVSEWRPVRMSWLRLEPYA